MSVTVALSVTDLTTRAATIAVLAIVALLATGWRKTARAEHRSPRSGLQARLPGRARRRDGIVVEHLQAPIYRRPSVARRLLAAVTATGLGLLMGTLAAIVVAFSAALTVIWLSGLLRG